MSEGHAAPDATALARLIDHTVLKPDAAESDIDQLCREAVEYGFFSVCVNSVWVPHARDRLDGSAVCVCATIGFPLGAQPAAVKAFEAETAVAQGAGEIDMVQQVGLLKSGRPDRVLDDIAAVVVACHRGGALCKVILETHLLTPAELVQSCEIAMAAGADFVKTSTGFSGGGARVDDIQVMARTVAAKQLGVKASGGVRTCDDALRMVAAGATRIGTSSGIRIVTEARTRPGTADHHA